MSFYSKAIAFSAATLLTACASSPDSLQTSYISDVQYQDFNCKQIGAELTRISRRKNELYSSLKTKADRDNAQMAVGMVLFWPALFFLEGGDGPEAQEYSRLKGEYEALEQASLKKQCGYEFQRDPEPVKKEPRSITKKRR